MHVLHEENGGFKVGTVLAASDAALQVESPHGKRSKVKANAVLLRFDAPAPTELLTQAEALAADIDIDFLWQCCGELEFGFTDLAREYFGRTATASESAGILLKLHSAPMYFYRKGKGRYRAAPADILKAALEGQEKRRLIQVRIDAWVEELVSGTFPEVLRPIVQELLYNPDRNQPETKALERACEQTGLSVPRLLEKCGALPSSHDYHLGRFLFECFPKGLGFPSDLKFSMPAELPRADVAAFSLDDADTTEIDDAFSVSSPSPGRLRIGIHIAAPGLGFAPGSTLDAVARNRLSTAYFPGSKITMLPPEAIAAFSLAEGDARPALSLYLDVREDGFEIENRHTAIELVPIAANLRHHNTEKLDTAFPAGEVPADVPFSRELHVLWRFALTLEAARGKQPVLRERPEYTFRVENDRVEIIARRRGEPLDKLVAELMILANSTWGKLLDENDVPAIYRVQANGKVRMTTGAAAHQGLGVSHYAWSSSPLRRYVDLVNQWQLLALTAGKATPFRKNASELLSAVSDFEATYATYDEFQRRMERYWCLRWLHQEGIELMTGEVLRENLVRLDKLPLVVRVPSLPEVTPGIRVELGIGEIDFIDNELKCTFIGLHETAAPV